jgi:hypothetical protein
MKKEDAIKLCRHLNVAESSDEDKKLFAHCERMWVDRMIDDNFLFEDLLQDYFDAGLREFEQMDDTPITLKAVLFNRFCKFNDCVDVSEFKKFYQKYMK